MLQKKAQILWCGYTQYLDLERIMHSVVNTKKEEKKKKDWKKDRDHHFKLKSIQTYF